MTYVNTVDLSMLKPRVKLDQNNIADKRILKAQKKLEEADIAAGKKQV